MADEEAIRRKLKSLFVLSQRGEEHERAAAATMLKRLLGKHGIDVDDIDPENKAMHEFAYSSHFEKSLLHQIHYMVTNDDSPHYWQNKGQKKISYKVTHLDAVEIERLFYFYKEEWNREVKLFFQAFIQKNRIFGDGCRDPEAELTDEELEDLRRMAQMAKAIHKNDLFHQLETTP